MRTSTSICGNHQWSIFFFLRVATTLFLINLIVSCGQASFDGAGGSYPQPKKNSGSTDIKQNTEPVPSTGDLNKAEEQSFDLAKKSTKIDIVWAIDTSGSMSEEVEQVQRNLGNFTASLASRSDVRLLVVAERPTGAALGIGIELRPQSSERRQLEIPVGSTNALAILAAGICNSFFGLYDPDGSEIVCGRNVGYIESGHQVASAGGRLRSAIRPDSKVVMVVVTDDNAMGVDDRNFLSLIKTQLNGRQPTIYAFRGVQSRPGCRIANPGFAYDQLASATGGRVFDICTPDWSPNFSTLAASVTNLVSLTFSLKAPVKTIQSVTVDGRSLSEADYVINGQTIELKTSAVTTNNKTVIVKWQSP